MLKAVFPSLILLLAATILSADDPVRVIEDGEEDSTWIRTDRDGDGNFDYNLQINESGRKMYEELDFNHDGAMDDFYYYSDGVLERREIDSNYDGAVDIWVYLYEGVYIERYEMDKDFDGEVDKIETFGGEEAAEAGKEKKDK
ncbi:MAG: hypothetical protein ACLFRY_07575 [Spirochaetia bacterium]